MLTYHEALDTILAHIAPLPPTRAPLAECLGLTLAEEIVAREDIPCFDNSAMDGYAVRQADLADATPDSPVKLRVLEIVPAGQRPKTRVEAGTAVKVMTGGMIPDGADAVIQIEHVEQVGDKIVIRRPAKPNENIRPAGEDLKKGEIALSRGAELNAYKLALLAAVGAANPLVIARPRVAVLGTGSELLPIDAPLEPGKVRNSSSVAIAAQLRQIGAVPIEREPAHDVQTEVESTLTEMANSSDAIITIGAVSMGDFDIVRPAVEKLGEIVFWKVAIRPGSPFLFGRLHGKPFFGLPGNPTSAMVTFEMLVRPALMKMMGRVNVQRTTVRAVSSSSIKDKEGRLSFIRGICAPDEGGLKAAPVGPHGSGLHKPMALANCLILVPEDVSDIAEGDTVEVVLLD